MFNQWDILQARLDELMLTLADASLDTSKRAALQRELSQISPILAKHGEIVSLEKDIAEVQTQTAANSDVEMAELYQQELVDLQGRRVLLQQDLDDLMFPRDEHDDRSVFLEIRPGTGGQEAALFAGDLLKMYTNYALKKGWKAAVESLSTTDLGGLREAVLHIQGKDVYGHLKFESGVHRVQRVPATETAGRVHTSTATVAVLPEAEDVDITINPADLKIETFRAGGAGGQHVNKTESAIRITHIPTGVVVACQDDRSQHKNKATAMKILQSRILANQLAKEHEAMSKLRKDQVGSGSRSEKLRTYNYPQNRVTDHQVDVTLKKLDMVMLGELDEIIQALRAQERESRLQEPFLERLRSQL